MTPSEYVIIEFLPDVSWAGKYNTISCPAAHHYYEGRWLHNTQYLDDYSVFWLHKGGKPLRNSFWVANAFNARNLVSPSDMIVYHLPELVKNYEARKKGWVSDGHTFGQRKNGLFYPTDDRDGGEVSIGGHGFRPTLNSFMYGDAKAITMISRIAGNINQAELYDEKAVILKNLVQEKLWKKKLRFSRFCLMKQMNFLMQESSMAIPHCISIYRIPHTRRVGKN